MLSSEGEHNNLDMNKSIRSSIMPSRISRQYDNFTERIQGPIIDDHIKYFEFEIKILEPQLNFSFEKGLCFVNIKDITKIVTN